MRILITYLFCLFATAVAVAQVSVTGKVIDKENNEPLAGASVIVRGADGKIKKFASSKADGGFAMSVATIAGFRLEVSAMRYEKRAILLLSLIHI